MGQRAQLFVYCQNPANGLKTQYKSIKKYNSGSLELEQLRKKIENYEEAFGTNQNCIIAYHHQWLYGRSSLIAASNLILFNQDCEKESNPFKTQNEITGDEYLNLLTNLLGLFNSKLAKVIGRFGYEHFRLLNFLEPYMRTDFCAGDNNDGAIILDCINDSYCFVSIGSGDSTISQLFAMVPTSAHDFVKLYYPEQSSDSKTANIPATAEKQDEYFNNNRRMNRLFTKPFNSYRLMTQNELKKLFPDSFKNALAENQKPESDCQ